MNLTKDVLANEEINENSTILDAGCGVGQTSAYLAKAYNCNVVAVDVNQMMLEKARERFAFLGLSVNTLQASIEQLPFEKRSIDYVLSESVIAFTRPENSFKELYRTLKPTGKLIALEMVLEKPLPIHEEQYIADFYGMEKLLSKTEWYELIKSGGFTEIITKRLTDRINDQPLDSKPDFMLSKYVHPKIFKKMEQHLDLLNMYKEYLGYYLFKCY